MNAGTQNFNMNIFNLTHFPHHAEIWTSAGGHLGHVGQSCWAQLLFSLWTNYNTKIRQAFLRRNPKGLIQEGVTNLWAKTPPGREGKLWTQCPHVPAACSNDHLHDRSLQQVSWQVSLQPSSSSAPAPQQTLHGKSHWTTSCYWGSAALLGSHQLRIKQALGPIAG